jgi:hypothetical protein
VVEKSTVEATCETSSVEWLFATLYNEPLSSSLCSAFTSCLVPHLDAAVARKAFVRNGAEGELQLIVMCHRLRNDPLPIIGGPVTGSVTADLVAVLSSVCRLIWIVSEFTFCLLRFENEETLMMFFPNI